MSIKTLPLSALPVTVRDSSGHSHTEDFSQKFGDVLSNMLMRELGATFKDTDGYSVSVVHGCKVEFLEFCSFLASSSDKRTIRSLSELAPPLLNDFVDHLKRVSPSKHENGKTTHRWFRRWGTFRSRLAGVIAKDKFPYVAKQQMKATDGHTPYAMGMLLEALQAEIDRIRNKLHVKDDGTVSLKWFTSAKRGRVLSLDQIDAFTPGRTSTLTSNQLDELEKAFFEPDGRSHKQLAKDIGMSISRLYAVKQDWITKGRLNGRAKAKFNEDDIDLTIDDIIATFSFYLPDWPMVGGMRTVGISYRVYKSKCGVLHNVYKSKEEAESSANEIGGVFVAVSRDGRTDYSVLNPAERIMVYSALSDEHTFIVKKLAELMPGGTSFLRDEYLPTSYDWTVVFLYWLALTGWNVEAIRSINRLDVLRQIKKGGPNELLSKQHATFTVEIEQDDDDTPTITGEKRRSQPIGKPKLYTHVSDRNEHYGLFRVLQDYCKLTEPFVKYLDGDNVNRILFGFSTAMQVDLSILTRSVNFTSTERNTAFPSKNLSYLHNIKIFLEKNPIFEDEDHVIRVTNTNPRQLRVTYFTTLRSMNVPITLLVFLAGHNSEDTHLVHYSSGKHGTKILKERSRKQLNVLADKAFTGSLTQYKQAEKKRSNSIIQVFTHRNHPFMFCTDPYAPTWPNFDEYLKTGVGGVTKKACDYFHMCLMCDKCQVTEDTLPYLVRWLGDLHEWRRTKGGGNFPYFMYRRYQAIREVFDLCEADDLWAAKLRKAEIIAESDDFDAPPIWRGI